MSDFFAVLGVVVGMILFVVGTAAGITKLSNYDTQQTLRIHNERCGDIAANAGANEWKTNYEGECYYIFEDRLIKSDVSN